MRDPECDYCCVAGLCKQSPAGPRQNPAGPAGGAEESLPSVSISKLCKSHLNALRKSSGFHFETFQDGIQNLEGVSTGGEFQIAPI